MTLLQVLLPIATLVLGSAGTLATQWFTGRWTANTARRAEWNSFQLEAILETEDLLQLMWQKTIDLGGSRDRETRQEILHALGRGTMMLTRIDDEETRESARVGFDVVREFAKCREPTVEVTSEAQQQLKVIFKKMSESARDVGRPV